MTKVKFSDNVWAELKGLVELGDCSKSTAVKALALADFDQFETSCMSIGDYVDMLISLAKVK